jgi:hypothetical protein
VKQSEEYAQPLRRGSGGGMYTRKDEVDPGVLLRRERGYDAPSSTEAEQAAMTSHPFASIGTAKSRLRNRIVSAQRIITVAPASPSANTHVTMAAYDGACEHLRSDIMRARSRTRF